MIIESISKYHKNVNVSCCSLQNIIIFYLLDAIAIGRKNYNWPDLFLNILPNTVFSVLFGMQDYLQTFEIIRVGERKKRLTSQLKLKMRYWQLLTFVMSLLGIKLVSMAQYIFTCYLFSNNFKYPEYSLRIFLRTVFRLLPISNILSMTSYEYATNLLGSSTLLIAYDVTSLPLQSTMLPIVHIPLATLLFKPDNVSTSSYSIW